MYKLIAIDMDGTLLKHDKTMSEKTKEVIEKARVKGARVVLASGRPLEGLENYLEELGLTSDEDYVICYNGAIVQNVKTKQVIGRTILKGQDLIDLYALSKELGVNIHAFSKNGCVTPIMTTYSKLEGDINGISVHVINYDEIDPEEEIIKIMFVDEPETLQKAVDQLPKEVHEKYTVVRSAPYFLEFLNKEVNKGEGVSILAEHLNVDREEVMCFGDAGNDLHMIEFAGMGVAMGNAFPEVKEVANYITKSNEEDGVAYAIEKFVLANE